jgi:diadenosine tetraphosphate (Ap4A) HIT family hydrolase
VRAGNDPGLIAELRESYALVHKHQRYLGWCTLWLKDHHEHLGLLPAERQARLAADVADAAAAMHRAFSPLRINYECLCNVVPHLHWHLIPRRADDPDPRATVWVRPAQETECGADPGTIGRVADRMRAAGLRGIADRG